MTAWWPRRVLPVLMYHRVGRGAGDPALWIAEDRFQRHLEWMAARRVRILSLDEAFAALVARRAPRKGVLLTFDDAFAETLDAVEPLLAATGTRAAVFAPAGLLGRTVRWRHPNLPGGAGTEGTIATAERLRAWQAAGHGVGSHGLTHLDLVGRPAREVRHELAASRDRLEEALGRPVRDFCYPFARHDASARSEAAEAGYRAAYAGEPPHDDLYAVPRMMVYPGDSERRFARKLSGHYHWLSSLHALLRRRRQSR